MNYIVTGDWHLTTSNPRIRKDDYPKRQLDKVEWICNLANTEKACVMVTGDVFDRPSYLSYPLMNRLVAILRTVKKGVFVIFGQHDIHYHNPNITKTPLGLLLSSGVVKWAWEQGKDICQCNYGEDYTKCSGKILVVHYSITPKEPPFFLKDAKSAKSFMDEVKWADYIFSGDFHEHHVTLSSEQILVNPGPISRAEKDKMRVIPKVVLVDTTQNFTQAFDIPIEQDVFDLDKVDRDNVVSYKEDVRELAENIRTATVGKKYHEILEAVVKASNPRKEVKTVISQVMEEVYGRTKTA